MHFMLNQLKKKLSFSFFSVGDILYNKIIEQG